MAWVVAFGLVFALDFVWAFYVKMVQKDAGVAAAGWAATLFIVAAFATIGYVEDHWLLVPCAAGAFCGTYAGVWWSSSKKHLA